MDAVIALASGEQGYTLESLPMTGSDVGLYVLIAVLLMALGYGLHRAVQHRLEP